MRFYAYMLRCSDGHYYVGHTDDLDHRFAQHQAGAIPGYTHDRRPVELVWSQDFPTRIEALEAERRIKGWTRAKKEALIRGDWEAIQRLAKKDFASRPDPALRYGASHSLSAYSGQTDGGSTEETDSPSPFPFVLSSSPSDCEESISKDHRQPPVIVLVRPQLGENIGKAARAMLNFGLTELRLVSPRDGWPNPDAGPAASGADEVLAGASVHASLADAVADCPHVYATTVRKRGVTKPVVTPAEAAHEIHAQAGRSALVFGPERSGLETDDVALARKIVTVPINPGFGSLNLAQAVILCAYEWSKGVELASPPTTELDPPAPQAELEGLIGKLETMLEPTGYFHPDGREHITRRTLRNMLTKPGWNAGEVRTLRGVLSALRKGPRRTD